MTIKIRKTKFILTVKPQIDGITICRSTAPAIRAARFSFWKRKSATRRRGCLSIRPPKEESLGVQIAYRVKATYKGESSPWSQVAVVYFKV